MKIKRFLLSILALALIFISIPTVAAYASGAGGGNYAIEEAAAICRDIGILLGGDKGVDEAYLAELTTRLQAMTLTVRLIGKESVASSYVWTTNFTDAHLVDYEAGRNLLAYIKSHAAITGWNGDLAGKIDPFNFITAQAMYKVLLSVLGYVPDVDYDWKDTLEFAASKGMGALASKRGYLNNNDVSVMLVEALKTRKKNSEDTLCEYLVANGAIIERSAYAVSMLPGSPGFKPLLTYKEGGPLLIETLLYEEQKVVSIKFNTALNPTYAKSLKNYNYYLTGTGYMPLPSRCQTSMSGDDTVVIHFPSDGWSAYNGDEEADAFLTYIAIEKKGELRVSGLLDVDGVPLRDVFIDVPAADKYKSNGNGAGGFSLIPGGGKTPFRGPIRR